MARNARIRCLVAALLLAVSARTSIAGGKIVALAGGAKAPVVFLDDLGAVWSLNGHAPGGSFALRAPEDHA